MVPIGFFAEISPGRSTIPVANGFFAKVKVAVASNATAPNDRRTIRVIMEIAEDIVSINGSINAFRVLNDVFLRRDLR